MCGGYGNEDSNNDGKTGGFLDFFADITDGGGAGYSGARFGGGTGSSVLDDNNDMYISEKEYMRGQKASEANDDRGGTFGDAYNSSQNIFSRGSNVFGALPRGSIRQEASLGSGDGTPIETKNMVRYLQMGGMPGAAIRGVSGFLGEAAGAAGDMAMAPVRAYRGEGVPPNPVVTPEQAAISSDSIFNTGSSQFDKLPQDRREAIIRGTLNLNAKRELQRRMAQQAAQRELQSVTPVKVTSVGNDMVEVAFSDGTTQRMTQQEARNNNYV